MKDQALKVLIDFAVQMLDGATLEEQIRIYNALGEILPTESQRAKAREISKVLSQAAALQLDFTSRLFQPVFRP